MADIIGTNQSETLDGTALDDLLSGLGGNDSLNALGGDDELFGGTGNDTLDGGSGNDRFVFERFFASSGGSDTVVDFTPGEDRIDVSGLGIAQFSTLEQFINNNSDNNAFISSILDNDLYQIEIQGIRSNQLTADDFIFSNNLLGEVIEGDDNFSSDDLFGGRGNDTLNGLGGDDRLFGEQGADRLFGGTGNDTLDGGIGNDRLFGENNNDVLNGGEGGDRLLGSTGNDTLNGGNGNDILNGGAGRDRLLGSAGDDTLNGGGGRDFLIFKTNGIFDSSVIGIDTINNFSVNQDQIRLSKNTFTALDNIANGQLIGSDFAVVSDNGAARTSSAEIVYNQNNGSLFYNPNNESNGFGSGGLFATIVGSPDDLSGADFFVFDV